MGIDRRDFAAAVPVGRSPDLAQVWAQKVGVDRQPNHQNDAHRDPQRSPGGDPGKHARAKLWPQTEHNQREGDYARKDEWDHQRSRD